MKTLQTKQKIDIPLLLDEIKESICHVRGEISFGLGIPGKSVFVNFRKLDKFFALQFTPENEVLFAWADKDKELILFDGPDGELPYDADTIKEKVISFFQEAN
jgi:hypothetical protein